MKIRNTKLEDLDKVLKIYEHARKFMKLNGNPNQWKDSEPSLDLIINDIKNNNSYIIEKDNNIVGVFSFIIGKDDSYNYIKDGMWLNDEEYGTIHRIASNGSVKGIFESCLKYCESIIDNIRIDTHHNNFIMQYLIEKNGFTKCGIIFVRDGSPRIAYQRKVDK